MTERVQADLRYACSGCRKPVYDKRGYAVKGTLFVNVGSNNYRQRGVTDTAPCALVGRFCAACAPVATDALLELGLEINEPRKPWKGTGTFTDGCNCGRTGHLSWCASLFPTPDSGPAR